MVAGFSAHLFRRKDGDEILVYLTNLLLDHSLVGFLLELLAGQPEHHVLLAELCPQELPEAAAPCGALHHLLKGRGPGAGLFQSRPRTDGTTQKSQACKFFLHFFYCTETQYCVNISQEEGKARTFLHS